MYSALPRRLFDTDAGTFEADGFYLDVDEYFGVPRWQPGICRTGWTTLLMLGLLVVLDLVV